MLLFAMLGSTPVWSLTSGSVLLPVDNMTKVGAGLLTFNFFKKGEK